MFFLNFSLNFHHYRTQYWIFILFCWLLFWGLIVEIKNHEFLLKYISKIKIIFFKWLYKICTIYKKKKKIEKLHLVLHKQNLTKFLIFSVFTHNCCYGTLRFHKMYTSTYLLHFDQSVWLKFKWKLLSI